MKKQIQKSPHFTFICGIIGIAAIILSFVLLTFRLEKPSKPIYLKNSMECTAYLAARGLDLEAVPYAIENITIPSCFTGVYQEYGALQEAQGFPLAECKGRTAVLYSYRLLDSPNEIVTLLVCGGKLVAGDLTALEPDAQMRPLPQ